MNNKMDNQNKECVFTKYDDQDELVLIAIHNTKKHGVELYTCKKMTIEEVGNLLKHN